MQEILEALRKEEGVYQVVLPNGGVVILDGENVCWGTGTTPISIGDTEGNHYLWQAFVLIRRVA